MALMVCARMYMCNMYVRGEPLIFVEIDMNLFETFAEENVGLPLTHMYDLDRRRSFEFHGATGMVQSAITQHPVL